MVRLKNFHPLNFVKLTPIQKNSFIYSQKFSKRSRIISSTIDQVSTNSTAKFALAIDQETHFAHFPRRLSPYCRASKYGNNFLGIKPRHAPHFFTRHQPFPFLLFRYYTSKKSPDLSTSSANIPHFRPSSTIAKQLCSNFWQMSLYSTIKCTALIMSTAEKNLNKFRHHLEVKSSPSR